VSSMCDVSHSKYLALRLPRSDIPPPVYPRPGRSPPLIPAPLRAPSPKIPAGSGIAEAPHTTGDGCGRGRGDDQASISSWCLLGLLDDFHETEVLVLG